MSSTSDPNLHTDTPDSHEFPAMVEAIQQLRHHSASRAVEIANDVLKNAVRAKRHSRPVRAHPPYDYVRISDQVLTATLRERVDANTPRASVGKIILNTDREAILQDVTIELIVQYGEVLLDVADQAREAAAEILRDTLSMTEPSIIVTATHVHISSISIGDPHLEDPNDSLR